MDALNTQTGMFRIFTRSPIMIGALRDGLHAPPWLVTTASAEDPLM